VRSDDRDRAIPFLSQIKLSSRGIVLAILSGAIASGVGYTVWYSALKHHTSTRACCAPTSSSRDRRVRRSDVLSEVMTTRLLIAASFCVEIGLTIARRRKK
jgi:hypothetical protein